MILLSPRLNHFLASSWHSPTAPHIKFYSTSPCSKQKSYDFIVAFMGPLHGHDWKLPGAGVQSHGLFWPVGLLKEDAPPAIFDPKPALGKYHYEVRQKGEKHTSKTWKLAQQKKNLDLILTWEAGSLFQYRSLNMASFSSKLHSLSISTHSSIATFLFEDFRGKNWRGPQKNQAQKRLSRFNLVEGSNSGESWIVFPEAWCRPIAALGWSWGNSMVGEDIRDVGTFFFVLWISMGKSSPVTILSI